MGLTEERCVFATFEKERRNREVGAQHPERRCNHTAVEHIFLGICSHTHTAQAPLLFRVARGHLTAFQQYYCRGYHALQHGVEHAVVVLVFSIRSAHA